MLNLEMMELPIDLQLVRHAECVELESQFDNVTDSEVLQNVEIIESRYVLVIFLWRELFVTFSIMSLNYLFVHNCFVSFSLNGLLDLSALQTK